MTRTKINVCCHSILSSCILCSVAITDELESIEGNVCRDMWKNTCWQMCEEVAIALGLLSPLTFMSTA